MLFYTALAILQVIHRKSSRVKGTCKTGCKGGAENIFQLKIGMQLVGITKEKSRQIFSKEVSFNLL